MDCSRLLLLWSTLLVATLAGSCGGTTEGEVDEGMNSDGGGNGDGGDDAAIADLSFVAPRDLRPPPQLDGSHGKDGPVMCAAFCAGCADTEDCFVSDFTAATCLSHCQTTTDCAKGYQCAELVVDAADVGVKQPPYTLSARLCFSTAAHLPPLCASFPANTHCTLTDAPICSDGSTLKQVTTAPGTCGYEYIHCPTACIPGKPDGGPMNTAKCT